MKISLLLLTMGLCQLVLAQTRFEWASAPQGVDMEYIAMDAMPDGGVFAVSDNDRLNEKRYEWKFVDGKGVEYNDYELISNSNSYRLLRFGDDGALLWYQNWQEDKVQVITSEVGEDGKIYLVVYVEYDDYLNDDYDYDEEPEEPIIEYGSIPDVYNDKYVKTQIGYSIVQLSEDGRLEKVVYLEQFDEEDEAEIADLELYNKDQFLIAGNVEEGTFTQNMELPCNGKGGDFIMLIDKDGKEVWSDIVVERQVNCCSGSMDRNNLSVADDGTIYLGSTYQEGACFSNGLHTIAPVVFKPKHYSKPNESYVISYSPSGKINWIRTAESNSFFSGLKATKNGVYIVHRVREDARSFGEEIDTIGLQNIVFTHLDKKGKTKWNVVTEMSATGGLVVDDQENLVVAGRLNKSGANYLKSMKVGKFELGEKIESLVIQISPRGSIIKVWGADFDTKGYEYPLLAMNKKGEFYLSTEVRIAGGLKLNLYYEELPAIRSNGWAAVLGKIKF